MRERLYLECETGISGDMMVAALLDLGADQAVLKNALKSLKVSGFQTKISRVKKAGLDACDFDVILDEEHENHDHDMEYLYGHLREHEHHHEHGEHDHDHHHGHEENGEHEHHVHEEHEEHEHHHGHRGMKEITKIIEGAGISERAKKIALRIFMIIAEAEAKAHGETVETVHFHEVGAVDSIVDVVSVAVCLDNLNIHDVVIPYLCEGTGSVRSQHGILPVPVPAVANIVQNEKIMLKLTNTVGELVTPTGAAIAAAIRTSDKRPEKFIIKKIGLGAGKRTYERPSILRALLIEPEEEEEKEYIYKLETNIDDCSGEMLGFTMERLLQAGARDVHFLPVYMKKNRPGCELVVICDEKQILQMEEIIFRETTTIGIRRVKMERSVLSRSGDIVMTKYGGVEVKKCVLPDGTVRYYPEYDSVTAVAKKHGVSYQEIADEVKTFHERT